MNNDLLRAIIKSASDTFNNLKITEVASPGDGNGLLTIEITNSTNTVYFPAIGGYITTKEQCLPTDKTIEESATSEYFAELREENAVINPVKVIISSRSWSAILIALNTSVQKIDKIAVFQNNLWLIDKGFIEILNKVSTHGFLRCGSARLCCGITPDEYGTVTNDTEDNRAVKRMYPGGGFAYQDLNCLIFIEMTNKTFLPANPFHRCANCRRWLHRHVKKLEEISTKECPIVEEMGNSEKVGEKNRVTNLTSGKKRTASKKSTNKNNTKCKEKKDYDETSSSTDDESEWLKFADNDNANVKQELKVVHFAD